MDVSVQRMAGCLLGEDYPTPIVDDKTAMTSAKERMYALRQSQELREAAKDVLARHGSRQGGLPPSGQGRKVALKRAAVKPSQPSRQGDLFA
ncbi:FAD-binding domain-containing protein [Rhodoferax sp. PAMC 29310]|uniref:FAD-binding domain-containing protein n=1 Tax=Rhodoferax sp. PAMC 29310 TaxID=2822760 RepID=UPI001F0B4114|nr:FAD-binding domain-containing protein [Rhodoferax sp. PAMC 29310]